MGRCQCFLSLSLIGFVGKTEAFVGHNSPYIEYFWRFAAVNNYGTVQYDGRHQQQI